MCSSSKLTLLAILSIMTIGPVHRAHAVWPVDGAPVSRTPGNQYRPVGVPDGSGGAIIAWVDQGIESSIHAQRIDASGSVLWGTDGISVCSYAGAKDEPCVVSDGVGGAIITWTDKRGGGWDIFAQRIDPSGSQLWEHDGIKVCVVTGNQQAVSAVADDAGGVHIAWTDLRTGSISVYVQHVDASGNVLWQEDGVLACDGTGSVSTNSITSDGAGGAIVTWTDNRFPALAGSIFAQRIDASGNAQWMNNGVAVCTAPGSQYSPQIATDDAGGAIIAWVDGRNYFPSEYDIFAQRIDGSGNPIWTADGVGVCLVIGYQSGATVLADGAGGAVIAWDDDRSVDVTGTDIYAQRLNSLGSELWTSGGVAVCRANQTQWYPRIAADGTGGTLITWMEDIRYFGVGARDIFAQKLDPAGNTAWLLDGVAVSTGTSSQFNPTIVPDGLGGAILAWEDGRGPTVDIYAQRVSSAGVVEQTLLVVCTTYDSGSESLRWAIEYANAAVGPQTIEFDIPGPGPHVIAPGSPLPLSGGELVIDGFTQPGASPNTNPVGQPSNAVLQIVLDGTNAGTMHGLNFQHTGEAHGLVIQNFAQAGILVSAYNCVIDGCYIGTDVTGTLSRPNGTGIDAGANTLIGGAAPAARNVISGNSGDGILIRGGADGVVIQGCYVGASADVGGLHNAGSGIHLRDQTLNSRVGGESLPVGGSIASQANIIAFNENDGVMLDYSILADAPMGNLIAGNSIYSNGDLDMDLDDDGITPNDPGDGDAGSNGLQNSPTLVQVGADIQAAISSAKNDPVYVHFYRTGTRNPLTGEYGPSAYLGETMAVTDENGEALVTFTPPAIPPGNYVVATETGSGFNTSEFSPFMEYLNTPPGNDVTVELLGQDLNVRGTVTFTEVRTPGQTTLTTPFNPPVPVTGWVVDDPNDPAIYFDLTTTAEYVAPIEVCINYDENTLPGPEANLKLVHYQGAAWVDVTTSLDTAQDVICGNVDSLSPFVIAVPVVSAVDDEPLPASFALHANIPNPFNPVTTVAYEVPAGGADVNISVFDVSGRLVHTLVNEHRAAGTWSVQWNGTDDRGQRVASGVYFYRMRAGEFVETRKMVLLK